MNYRAFIRHSHSDAKLATRLHRWLEVLGSERLTGAALDRLTHRRHILEAKGEIYRLKYARRRQRREGPTA